MRWFFVDKPLRRAESIDETVTVFDKMTTMVPVVPVGYVAAEAGAVAAITDGSSGKKEEST